LLHQPCLHQQIHRPFHVLHLRRQQRPPLPEHFKRIPIALINRHRLLIQCSRIPRLLHEYRRLARIQFDPPPRRIPPHLPRHPSPRRQLIKHPQPPHPHRHNHPRQHPAKTIPKHKRSHLHPLTIPPSPAKTITQRLPYHACVPTTVFCLPSPDYFRRN